MNSPNTTSNVQYITDNSSSISNKIEKQIQELLANLKHELPTQQQTIPDFTHNQEKYHSPILTHNQEENNKNNKKVEIVIERNEPFIPFESLPDITYDEQEEENNENLMMDENLGGLFEQIEQTQENFLQHYNDSRPVLTDIENNSTPITQSENESLPTSNEYFEYQQSNNIIPNWQNNNIIPNWSPKSIESICVRDGTIETHIPCDSIRSRKINELQKALLSEHCTFKPKIRTLPKFYNSRPKHYDDRPFLQRLKRWEAKVALERKFLKDQVLENELQECTFNPENKTTTTAMNNKQRNVDSFQSRISRELLFESRHQEEEEEFKKNCTFKPQILEKSRELSEKAREVPTFSVRHTTKIFESGDNLDGCTFKPKITPYELKSTTTRIYMEQDTFQRLNNYRGQIVNPKKVEESEEKEEKGKKVAWENLMSRFDDFDKRKETTQSELMDRYSFSFQPEFCPKSIRIANSRGLDWEERYQDSVRKLNHRERENELRGKINQKSLMSRGSRKILKNTHPEELVRRAYTDQTKVTHTFKPKTNQIPNRKTKQLENYLKQPACERLFQATECDPFHDWTIPIRSSSTESERFLKNKKSKEKKIPQNKIEEFNRRQENFLDYVNKKLEYLKNEEIENKYKYEKPNVAIPKNLKQTIKLKTYLNKEVFTRLSNKEFYIEPEKEIPFEKADRLEEIIQEKLKKLNDTIGQECPTIQPHELNSPKTLKKTNSYYKNDLLRKRRELMDKATKMTSNLNFPTNEKNENKKLNLSTNDENNDQNLNDDDEQTITENILKLKSSDIMKSELAENDVAIDNQELILEMLNAPDLKTADLMARLDSQESFLKLLDL